MKSEIDHILIELKCDRRQHLRHFIDNYFCYKNGYITRNGNPDSNKIFWNEFVSERAIKLKSRQGKKNNKGVRKEHIIPISVISGLLSNLKTQNMLNRKTVAKILERFTLLATITVWEDRKLQKCKFQNRMPKGISLITSQKTSLKKLLSRYEKAGIKLRYRERISEFNDSKKN